MVPVSENSPRKLLGIYYRVPGVFKMAQNGCDRFTSVNSLTDAKMAHSFFTLEMGHFVARDYHVISNRQEMAEWPIFFF